jgi:malate dehydrogenase (oxaloacetate-decarboxylating)(NADP+)
LAGLLAGIPLTGTKKEDHKFLFLGAGEAGCGCAELIALALSKECNISIEEARGKIWLVDSKGLVVASRRASVQLEHHKIPFAHDHPSVGNLIESVKTLKPTCLIGLSTCPGAFNEEICKYMASINERPIIMALSNPTSMAECTAEEAYTWTEGRCLFASGSPFDPVELDDGRRFVPGQGNNAYIFPGIGLGIVATASTKVTDEHMYIAAKALASQVTEKDTSTGALYPPLSDIREVSSHIAAAIAEDCFTNGYATVPRPHTDLLTFCKSHMYNPTY